MYPIQQLQAAPRQPGLVKVSPHQPQLGLIACQLPLGLCQAVEHALAGDAVGWIGLIAINVIFVVAISLAELTRKMKHLACKYVKYDRIELIVPARRAELIADLEKRLGITVRRVDIGTVNFLKDMALLKVWYEPEDGNEENTVDELIRKVPNF